MGGGWKKDFEARAGGLRVQDLDGVRIAQEQNNENTDFHDLFFSLFPLPGLGRAS
jgi:hypothetical protein